MWFFSLQIGSTCAEPDHSLPGMLYQPPQVCSNQAVIEPALVTCTALSRHLTAESQPQRHRHPTACTVFLTVFDSFQHDGCNVHFWKVNAAAVAYIALLFSLPIIRIKARQAPRTTW